MRTMTWIAAVATAVICATSNTALADKWLNCKGGGPQDAKNAAADFSFCLKGGACDPALNAQPFNNDEKKLPKVNKNQYYYEARVGTDHNGFGGVRRLVFLVQGEAYTSKAVIQMKYYSPDHYVTFCKM